MASHNSLSSGRLVEDSRNSLEVVVLIAVDYSGGFRLLSPMTGRSWGRIGSQVQVLPWPLPWNQDVLLSSPQQCVISFMEHC